MAEVVEDYHCELCGVTDIPLGEVTGHFMRVHPQQLAQAVGRWCPECDSFADEVSVCSGCGGQDEPACEGERLVWWHRACLKWVAR